MRKFHGSQMTGSGLSRSSVHLGYSQLGQGCCFEAFQPKASLILGLRSFLVRLRRPARDCTFASSLCLSSSLCLLRSSHPRRKARQKQRDEVDVWLCYSGLCWSLWSHAV